MAQADDIKELQAQVKDLTERLAKLETAEPAEVAAPVDDSRLATLEAQVEKIRVHTNAP